MSSGTGVETVRNMVSVNRLQAKLRRPGGGGCVLNWNCVETAIDFKRRSASLDPGAIGSG
jgi:hypothetical protein